MTLKDNKLPVHFITIVLDGEPFIRYPIQALKGLPFPWVWHIVEGVADLVRDTAWSVQGGGRVDASLYPENRSRDGTSEYLDALALEFPSQVRVYRKSPGRRWRGKLEMISAPLASLPEECLLWQMDADELWTQAQIERMRRMFLDQPSRTAAWFWCDYFVGPNLVTKRRDGYGNHREYEWLRVWRFRRGMRWASHEPPRLIETAARKGEGRDVGKIDPFLHDEMEQQGLVFQHFAYVLPEQLRFKGMYYGYGNGVESWEKLQTLSDENPVLRDYLPWVQDRMLVSSCERAGVVPIARIDAATGRWSFLDQEAIPERARRQSGAPLERFFFRWRTVRDGWKRKLFASTGFFWMLKAALTFLVVDLLLWVWVPRRNNQAVVLIKMDRLGDYVLARPFLRRLKDAPDYAGRKIFLCADPALKEMIEAYDGDQFDGFVWVDRNRFVNEAAYRFQALREVRHLGADIALHPTYAREAYLGDALVWATGAPHRIGREAYQDPGRSWGQRQFQRAADWFYTRLIPEDPQVKFDFYRTRDFFAKILPRLDPPRDTRLHVQSAHAPQFAARFAVLMPGANQSFRAWPPERFAEVARLLAERYGLDVVLLGTLSDSAAAAEIMRQAAGVKIEDWCGELTLPQVIEVLSRCTVGIANESGGIHLLAALDKPAVAVVNGNRFGWFYPYPNDLQSSVRYVYPPAFHSELRNGRSREEYYRGHRHHPLEEVLAVTVADAVGERLGQQEKNR